MLSGRFQGSGGYAVVDLEATGSSSRRHRVIEVAVVLLDRECVPQGEFSTLIDPEGPVGPTHIHGIERHDLGGAPTFAGIAPRLLGLLRGRVLVGHNVGCDRAFLAAEYARLGVTLPAVPELCTMRMAISRVPGPRGFSLGACVADAGLGDWAAHTALGDARATARLFAHYVAEAADVAEAAEVAEVAGRIGVPGAVETAAGVEWPVIARLPEADALWLGRASVDRPPGGSADRSVERSAEPLVEAAADWSAEIPNGPKGWNDSPQRMVSCVRNGSA
ncbi:3'-5' exonuclease [Streptomyces sp. SPB162]|uniref:3'-5' exonuclease n=1 Tax=Streptomyces sp. SPB162 TaxID=2940560 RepID=UPI0024068FFD|nr:3'-5' exonuclease [Streptomyces sp. SPB162]MDF9814867.1 DNA polymerase-3 subunit epsilon [Streptomyces sp. SPB162]